MDWAIMNVKLNKLDVDIDIHSESTLATHRIQGRDLFFEINTETDKENRPYEEDDMKKRWIHFRERIQSLYKNTNHKYSEPF